jgi:formate hydrogenlyase subunit 4
MENINILILVFIFLFFPIIPGGIIRKIRAMAQGRKGPPLLQNLYDFQRLFSKNPVDGVNANTFAAISPYLSVYAVLFVWSIVLFEWIPFLMIPFFLGLIRICITGFAMETGSSFGGLGTSRELLLYVCSEPIIVLSLLVAQSNIHLDFNFVSALLGILFFGAMLVGILTETSKPPFDDPRTHLELTMVHEAMLLEASGRTLALFELSSHIKLTSLLFLLFKIGVEHSNFPLLESYGHIPSTFAIVFGVISISILVGYWESISVRRKWRWVPEILGLTFLILIALGTLVKL